ncbi:MAG: hypothetical protein EP335_03475 [Alphaproteobacteria bacterium]|nr:MAG: hypothetical protein EP335_03475 [Alphaproteobacteria bacterium]
MTNIPVPPPGGIFLPPAGSSPSAAPAADQSLRMLFGEHLSRMLSSGSPTSSSSQQFLTSQRSLLRPPVFLPDINPQNAQAAVAMPCPTSSRSGGDQKKKKKRPATSPSQFPSKS